MFIELETYFKERTNLSEADINLLQSMGSKMALRKNEVLLREGDVCRYKIFVCKGILRTYSTKEDGSEHILQFSAENRWSTDPESFEHGTPARYSIDAVEGTEVIVWTKNDWLFLHNAIPELKVFSQNLIVQNLNHSRQRILSAISSTAEEKYDEFINAYPDVFARVPLHMVASYLGLSRKTLSRIRFAQLKG